MQIRKLAPLFLLLTTAVAIADAQKVKRKGVTPIDVSKNKRPDYKPGPRFSTEKLVGKWQEISRTDKSKKSVEFTDTIYLNFTSEKTVITRDGNNANMSGSAIIEEPGNVLLAAADVYTILSLAENELVLDNQENFIHTLKKTEQFSYENYGKLAVKQDEYKEAISPVLTDVLGKWAVYRKEAKPGSVNPPTNIIQLLNITDSTSENTAKGEVSFYQTDKSKSVPCTIKLTNMGFDIMAGEFHWQLYVYKADKKELVFGDASTLLYYAKSIKQN